jgi:hypothetical protein
MRIAPMVTSMGLKLKPSHFVFRVGLIQHKAMGQLLANF